MKAIFPRVLAFYFGFLLVPGAHNDAAAEGPKVIRIGGIFDLTSDAGKIWGVAEKSGFELAIKDFRISHPDIEVTAPIEDSHYSSVQSVSALQKLTAVDGVQGVVGPTWEVFTATMPICEATKILCFAPSNNGAEFRNPKRPLRYSFTAWIQEEGYGTELARLANDRHAKRIVIFSAISPYFDFIVDAFLKTVDTPPITVHRLPMDVTDFRSLITVTPDDVDLVVANLDGGTQAYPFYRQWSELKRHRPLFLTHDGGAIFASEPEKIRALNFDIRYSIPVPNTERDALWRERYKAEFHSEPEAPSASVSYDETMILLNCISDTTDKGESSPEALRECVAALHEYSGMSGKITFTKNAVTSRDFEIRRFSDDKTTSTAK